MSFWWKMVLRVWAEDDEWPPPPDGRVSGTMYPVAANLSLGTDAGIDMSTTKVGVLQFESAGLALTGNVFILKKSEIAMFPAASLVLAGTNITMTLSTVPESLVMSFIDGAASLVLSGTDITMQQTLGFFAEVGTTEIGASSGTEDIALSRFNGGSPNTLIMFTGWCEQTTEEVRGTGEHASFGMADEDKAAACITTACEDLDATSVSDSEYRNDSVLARTSWGGANAHYSSVDSYAADKFVLDHSSAFGDQDSVSWLAIGGDVRSKLIQIGIAEGDIGGGECYYEHGLNDRPTALIFLTTSRHTDAQLNTSQSSINCCLGMWAENDGVWSQVASSRDAAGTTDEFSYATDDYALSGATNTTTGAVQTQCVVERVDTKYIVLRWDPLLEASQELPVHILALSKVRAFVSDDEVPTSGSLTLTDAGFVPQAAIFANQGQGSIDATVNDAKFFLGADDGTDAACQGWTHEHNVGFTEARKFQDQNRSLCAWNASGSISPSSNSRRMLAEINTFAAETTITIADYPPAATPFGYMMLAPALLADVETRASAYGDEYGAEYGYQ